MIDKDKIKQLRSEATSLLNDLDRANDYMRIAIEDEDNQETLTAIIASLNEAMTYMYC